MKLIIKIKKLYNMGLSVYTLVLGLLGHLKEIIMGWSYNMDARKNKSTKGNLLAVSVWKTKKIILKRILGEIGDKLCTCGAHLFPLCFAVRLLLH
jgi:hypothetical protein